MAPHSERFGLRRIVAIDGSLRQSRTWTGRSRVRAPDGLAELTYLPRTSPSWWTQTGGHEAGSARDVVCWWSPGLGEKKKTSLT